MNMTCNTVGLTQPNPSTPRAPNFLRSYWGALQEWRKRANLRDELHALNDAELVDIGITRGEIDFFALDRSIDSRGGGR